MRTYIYSYSECNLAITSSMASEGVSSTVTTSSLQGLESKMIAVVVVVANVVMCNCDVRQSLSQKSQLYA